LSAGQSGDRAQLNLYRASVVPLDPERQRVLAPTAPAVSFVRDVLNANEKSRLGSDRGAVDRNAGVWSPRDSREEWPTMDAPLPIWVTVAIHRAEVRGTTWTSWRARRCSTRALTPCGWCLSNVTRAGLSPGEWWIDATAIAVFVTRSGSGECDPASCEVSVRDERGLTERSPSSGLDVCRPARVAAERRCSV